MKDLTVLFADHRDWEKLGKIFFFLLLIFALIAIFWPQWILLPLFWLLAFGGAMAGCAEAAKTIMTATDDDTIWQNYRQEYLQKYALAAVCGLAFIGFLFLFCSTGLL